MKRPHQMERLKQIREEQGLTIRQLAEMTGVAPSTISQVEQGKRSPRRSTMEVLMAALNVSYSNMEGSLEDKYSHEGEMLIKLVPILRGADHHIEQLGPDFEELKNLFAKFYAEFNERMVEVFIRDSDEHFKKFGDPPWVEREKQRRVAAGDLEGPPYLTRPDNE